MSVRDSVPAPITTMSNIVLAMLLDGMSWVEMLLDWVL